MNRMDTKSVACDEGVIPSNINSVFINFFKMTASTKGRREGGLASPNATCQLRYISNQTRGIWDLQLRFVRSESQN